MTQFDGITYGKGASVLKQLRFWLGDDAFREGLHRYFLKFSQKNTTLADLLSALAESSGKNLTIWQKEWLQEPGTNTLKAEFSCEDEKIQSFTLLQGNRKHSKTLRTHRTRVALYRRTKSGDLSLSDALDVTYSGERTVVTGLHGKPCPAFVFPNHEDHDFVLVELDETSLESFSKDPKQPQDPLTRDMVWHSLSESTRDGKFSPMRLGKLALQALKTERDAPRAKLLLALLFSPELAGGSVSHFLTSSKQEEVLTELQSFLRERLKLKSTPRDLQMEYWNRFLSLSVRFTDSDRKWLRGLLSGTAAPPKGVDLGEDRRWEILGALAQADDPEVLTLIDLQSKRDPSQAGVIEYHAARASQRGNRSIRQEYLEAILDPAKLSARNLKTQVMKSTIRRFYQFEDPSSESERIDTYRKLLNGFSNSATPLGALIRSDEGYGRTLLRGLYPVACGGASLAELRTLLESSRTKIPVYAERTLRELFTTSEECEAIRN
jgi:aminopeptidase N